MNHWKLKLRVYTGSEYSPELSVELSKSSKREIADTLIALVLVLKDHDLPERDKSGRFLPKTPPSISKEQTDAN